MATRQIFSFIILLLLYNSFSLPVSVFITSLLPYNIITSLRLGNFPSKLTTIKAHFSAFTFKLTVVFHCNQKTKTCSLLPNQFLITPFILEFSCSIYTFCPQISREYISEQSGLTLLCFAG